MSGSLLERPYMRGTYERLLLRALGCIICQLASKQYSADHYKNIKKLIDEIEVEVHRK